MALDSLNEADIKQFGFYLCAIEPRPSHDGCPLRDAVRKMTGKFFILQAYWKQEEGDPYPGEWALGDNHELSSYEEFELSWISSGDVKIVQEVNQDNIR